MSVSTVTSYLFCFVCVFVYMCVCLFLGFAALLLLLFVFCFFTIVFKSLITFMASPNALKETVVTLANRGPLGHGQI